MLQSFLLMKFLSKKVLGEAVGKLFQQTHESKGVQFKLGAKATAIKGKNKAEAVELESGETIEADLVVVGIGVKPATDFVEGLLMDEDDGSILVNQYLQATSNVYARGRYCSVSSLHYWPALIE